MLLQTNSYVVPKERRVEHARVVRRFRQALLRLGCDQFEVYEQVGTNWTSDQSSGRFVQIMRFRDRKHQLSVQAAEKNDAAAQAIIAEFCELINFPYQQQQGLFAIGYYTGILGGGKLLGSADVGPESVAPATAPAVVATAPLTSEPITMVKDVSNLVPAAVTEAAGGEDTASAGVHHPHSPFADAPIVAPPEEHAAGGPAGDAEVAGRNGEHGGQPAAAEPVVEVINGNGNGHPRVSPIEAVSADELDPAVLDVERSPASAAVDLDELIKQHFGEEPRQGLGEDREGLVETAGGGGSGIGAVLDAGMGDDPDLDVALPAELLENPGPAATGRAEPNRRHDEIHDA